MTPRIRFGARVEHVAPGWEVDGERFDAVAVASGRFRRPRMAPGLDRFGGELLHAFDYPGAEPFRGRRVLVYGNGISGLEIASDLAGTAEVISAFRKPRYVISKVVDGVSSDWQWYTAFGALERARLPPAEFGRRLRERIVRVAGDPAAFGAPAPDPDILVAGVSLCQDYLAQVADGSIVVPSRDRGRRARRGAVRGRDAREPVDAIVSATGYELDVPFLDPSVWAVTGPDLRLYRRALHPDLPGFGAVGLFPAQGPFFSLLELQARWLVALWAGDVEPPDAATMRRALALPPPPLEVHNVFATRRGLRARRRARPARPARPDRAAAVRAAAPAALPARRAGRARRRGRATSARSSPPRRGRRSIRPTSGRCAASGSARRRT